MWRQHSKRLQYDKDHPDKYEEYNKKIKAAQASKPNQATIADINDLRAKKVHTSQMVLSTLFHHALYISWSLGMCFQAVTI